MQRVEQPTHLVVLVRKVISGVVEEPTPCPLGRLLEALAAVEIRLRA